MISRIFKAGLVSTLLAVAVARALPAQQPEMGGLSIGGIPHPVAAALAFWQKLGLNETQITQLRQISDSLESALTQRMIAAVQDTTEFWRMWRAEPIDSAALVKSAHAAVERDMPLQLEILRARDKTFAVLTADQVAMLQSQ